MKHALVQTARDTARGRLLTLVAGLFAAGALVFTALNFILSREGQVTDRYTKAVEQLGSDGLDVRIGGINALERVARDSAKDHPTVMEVLTAFIRDHSREQWPPPDPAWPGSGRLTRPDVQAAITVVGRRDAKRDIQPIDLTADQRRAPRPTRASPARTWTGAKLDSADLTGANFTGVRLPDGIWVPEGWIEDSDSGFLKPKLSEITDRYHSLRTGRAAARSAMEQPGGRGSASPLGSCGRYRCGVVDRPRAREDLREGFVGGLGWPWGVL